ncbi:hypothetical protein RRG08_033037 [Elysia crispata]|uniref:Nondiscriminating glutamyl-tRNA synthetase EARS2, mitochondrial n=1 Tax=Elysia crispata TaxID=231223 RepID=A0AAE1A8J1_9GAST|nr:hypothetical protein RRG08_033037 [Elysia crispata]
MSKVGGKEKDVKVALSSSLALWLSFTKSELRWVNLTDCGKVRRRYGFNTVYRESSTSAAEGDVRVRFAPSPTGFLHLGGLRTALYNYLFARANRGTFILRIEDTDQNRAVSGAIEKLEETLQWAQLKPDEGPSAGGKFGPYIQSQRLHIYQEHVQTLLSSGAAYRCYCSERRLELMRKDAARRGEPSRYDGKCRNLSEETVKNNTDQRLPFTVRLKLKPTPEPWDDLIKGESSHDIFGIEGDPILLKSDGYPTYHFANVVDDHLMGITHVLRGSEWLSSTPKHILLYKALGWSPPAFGHLPLIVNPDGTKLSKRQGDVNIEHYQTKGYFPQAVINYITSIGGGFHHDTLGKTLEEMVQSFDVKLIRTNPGRLDPTWLTEANRKILKEQAWSKDRGQQSMLASRVREMVNAQFGHRFEAGQEQILSDDYILAIVRWSLQDDRTSVTSDFIKPELDYLWVPPSRSSLSGLASLDKRAESVLKDLLTWLETLGAESNFETDLLLEELRRFIKDHNLETKKFFQLARLALTGSKQGAPLAETISIIGRENVLVRLKAAIDVIKVNSSS